MLVLLPPSESKVRGGDPDRPLDLAGLSRPALGGARRTALARLRDLSSNLTVAAGALGLGAQNRGEAELNRHVRTGPTMPAIERFDGVLYDALDAGGLDADARRWLDGNVAIASALFGLVAPEDRIPAYRLSADTRIPGTTLRAIWRDRISGVLAQEQGPMLDLRSEAYAALGAAPAGSVFVRVVTEADGRRRALNHFNKAAKGRLVRELAVSRPEVACVDDVIDWAGERGIRLEQGAPGELDLVVEGGAARPNPPTVAGT